MRSALIAIAVLGAACAPSQRAIPTCEVGERAPCACTDGSEGTQSCNAKQAFEPCVCDGTAGVHRDGEGPCDAVAANMIHLSTAELERDTYMTPERKELALHVINRAGALLAQTCERQQWSADARTCAESATTRTQLTDCEDMAYRTRGSGTPECDEVAAHIRSAASLDPDLPSEGPLREEKLAQLARDVLASCKRERWSPEERRCMTSVVSEVDYRLCEEMIDGHR